MISVGRIHHVGFGQLGPENALDHVVVVMFENRSFDNLLGRLYEPGEAPAFEGVLGKELSNPVPAWLPEGGRDPIPYGAARDMNTPAPDPGEEFHHVNTQLFGILDEANRGQMEARGSYNAPAADRAPTMDGFVADYASMLLFENGRMPSYDEYAKIMSGYTPERMPVMSTIARGFATFDHWFCEVFIATLRERWKLGAPLTARDASARSFGQIFTSLSPRAQDDWPEVTARPFPAGPESMLPLDAPLGLLGKSLIGGVFALGKEMGAEVPDFKPDQLLTGKDGIDAAQHVLAELFPRLQER
ncbi:alkaline phosphatase family protein [Streptomyces sp. NPDC051677]|uniref:alkaline phosphatase family protein n=1 Tax=Streptomyces sp. NPDC051677 TaxID=3365669 RepID=UPI0037D05ECB